MNNSPQEQQLDIRYGQQAAIYTSQFMVNAGVEEVILDCISGVEATDGASTVVPVHSRLALPWGAVERLAKLLNETLEQRASIAKNIPAPHFPSAAAKLPSFGETNV